MVTNDLISNTSLSRNERRKLKTKESVRKAAIETFLELGYLNSTVHDITERADLAYSTFYQYYKNKQDVIIELVSEARELMNNDYEIPPETETNLYKRTLHRMQLVFGTFAKHRDVFKILLDCYITDAELHRAWSLLMEEPFTRLKKDLTWSMKRGICRDVNINTAYVALSGMVQAAGIYIVQNNLTEQEVEDVAKDVCLFFEKAIFKVEELPPELLQKTPKQ